MLIQYSIFLTDHSYMSFYEYAESTINSQNNNLLKKILNNKNNSINL